MSDETKPLASESLRFNEKWIAEPYSGCWLWIGTEREGYGRFGASHEPAHRASWRLHNGAIPNGLFVLHKCDVRSCVNPNHLFLGTHSDNAKDRAKKGRSNRPIGKKNGRCKLAPSDILQIRLDTRSQRVIGREYGVSKTHIRRIQKRKAWWCV